MCVWVCVYVCILVLSWWLVENVRKVADNVSNVNGCTTFELITRRPHEPQECEQQTNRENESGRKNIHKKKN